MKTFEITVESGRRVQAAVRAAIGAGLVTAAHDCSEGGVAAALAESCVTGPVPVGCEAALPAGARRDHVLFGEGPSPRQVMFYYRDATLMAVRKGPWKAHFQTQTGYPREGPQTHDPPLLFHLDRDPSEKYDVSKDHPDVIADLKREVAEHQAHLEIAPSQLEFALPR